MNAEAGGSERIVFVCISIALTMISGGPRPEWNDTVNSRHSGSHLTISAQPPRGVAGRLNKLTGLHHTYGVRFTTTR